MAPPSGESEAPRGNVVRGIVFPLPKELSATERAEIAAQFHAIAREFLPVLEELPTLEPHFPDVVPAEILGYRAGVRQIAEAMAEFYQDSDVPADIARFIEHARRPGL